MTVHKIKRYKRMKITPRITLTSLISSNQEADPSKTASKTCTSEMYIDSIKSVSQFDIMLKKEMSITVVKGIPL
jgi:hypothetical protein